MCALFLERETGVEPAQHFQKPQYIVAFEYICILYMVFFNLLPNYTPKRKSGKIIMPYKKAHPYVCAFFGARDGNRTRQNQLGKLAPYR